MTHIINDINNAFLFLRENNNTISSDNLELFKNILTEYFDKKLANDGGEVVIVPVESAKFCADKTISYMNNQVADFGDNEDLRELYKKHVNALVY